MSVAWFAAFALFRGIPLPGRAFVLSLAAGVAALLLNLTVAGGIAFPSVAQPLWAVAALAVGGTERTGPEEKKRDNTAADFRLEPAVFLGLSGLGAACLTYFLLIFSPVMASYTHLSRARLYRQEFQLGASQLTAPGISPQKRADIKRITEKLAEKAGLELTGAGEASPGDARPRLESARWVLERGQAYYRVELGTAAVQKLERNADLALGFLQQAKQLDPLGKEGPLQEFYARVQLAPALDRKREAYLGAAEELLDVLLERDRLEAARLHFALAQALFNVKEPAKGRSHAEKAAHLDEEAEEANRPAARLTRSQRDQVRKWLGPATSAGDRR
jgi:hypothetical protein